MFSIRWSDRFHCDYRLCCFLHLPDIVWLELPTISCFLTVGSRCIVACRSVVFESPRVLGAVLCVLPAISPFPFPRLRFLSCYRSFIILMVNISYKLQQSFHAFSWSSYRFRGPVLDLSVAVGILLIVSYVSEPVTAGSTFTEVVPSDV
jgi:hypothetical protein